MRGEQSIVGGGRVSPGDKGNSEGREGSIEGREGTLTTVAASKNNPKFFDLKTTNIHTIQFEFWEPRSSRFWAPHESAII